MAYYSNDHNGYARGALDTLFCCTLNTNHFNYFDYFNLLSKLLGNNAILHPAMLDKLTPSITENTNPIHKPLLLHGMFTLKSLANIRMTAGAFTPHGLPSTAEESATDANHAAHDASHTQLVSHAP